MTLADKIEAGEASDAEVALALGFYQAFPHDALLNGWKWHTPDGKWLRELPPLQTCLTTLAAECERLGFEWCRWRIAESEPVNPGKLKAQVFRRDGQWLPCTDGSGSAFGTGDTFAGALCAALVRAVEAKDG